MEAIKYGEPSNEPITGEYRIPSVPNSALSEFIASEEPQTRKLAYRRFFHRLVIDPTISPEFFANLQVLVVTLVTQPPAASIRPTCYYALGSGAKGDRSREHR